MLADTIMGMEAPVTVATVGEEITTSPAEANAAITAMQEHLHQRTSARTRGGSTNKKFWLPPKNQTE